MNIVILSDEFYAFLRAKGGKVSEGRKTVQFCYILFVIVLMGYYLNVLIRPQTGRGNFR